MMEAPLTSDFSPIALKYDATRAMPPELLEKFYRRLIEQHIIPANGVLLDAGCGTGQMSVVLANSKLTIRGYDISPAMIDIARSKIGSGSQVSYHVGDIRALPEPDATFDTILVSKLFMHIQDWQGACCELLRVLKLGGYLIEVFEPASYDNAVRRYFTRLAEDRGYTNRFIGLDPRDRADFVAFLIGKGCEKVSVDATDLRWEKIVRHGDVLDHFRDRILAEFWYLPDPVYADLLTETEHWVDCEPHGRNTIEQMAPYLAAEAFRKSPAT